MPAKAYLVDIKEDPHERGAILVEATAPDGTIEFATFSGPRAAHRSMKYVEAIEGFEKRPPREYPKHVRRGGVDHLALDAEHEKKLGEPTDADKAAEDAQREAGEAAHGQHEAIDEAKARAAAVQALEEPRPVLHADESDDDYAARLEKWQDAREAAQREAIGDHPFVSREVWKKPAEPLPS